MPTAAVFPPTHEARLPSESLSGEDVRDVMSFRCAIFAFECGSMHFVRKASGHGGPGRKSGQMYIDLLRPKSRGSRPAVAFQCPVTNTHKRVPLSHVHRLTANRLVCCPSYGSKSELFSSAAGLRLGSEAEESEGATTSPEQLPDGTESTTGTFDALFGLEFQDATAAESFLSEWFNMKGDCAGEGPASSSVGALALRASRKPGRGHIDKMDAAVVETYFEYYGKMANQMNMLQDSTRTTTYHRAILENRRDFEGKVVMDVGAGSGILSFFAAQAGAKKVYAPHSRVEACSPTRQKRRPSCVLRPSPSLRIHTSSQASYSVCGPPPGAHLFPAFRPSLPR